MTHHRLIAALIGLVLFYPSTVFAQNVDVDISACRAMLDVMKAIKTHAEPAVPSAMLDVVLDTRPYQTMFQHYNRPWRPDHLPKDVFKRMILSLRYPRQYAAGENARADSMLRHWNGFYANLPAHEANVQQLEKADLRKLIEEGLRRAQEWLPPEWKIPDFRLFVHPNGGSGAFAIEGAQGHDYFRLDRDEKGDLRINTLVGTISHESHHLGMGVVTPEGLSPSQAVAFKFLRLFVGEGTATKFVDNAPGGVVPMVDPARKHMFNSDMEQDWKTHTLEEGRIFQRMVATFEKAYRGELSEEALDKEYREYWLAGVTGPAYFVGAEMYGAIYTAFGREGLFAAMRDPRKTFQLYNDALKAKPELLKGCPEIPDAVAQHALSMAPSGKGTRSAPPSTASMEDVYAKGLEGDMKAGLALLKKVPPESLNPKDREAREKLLARFESGKAPELNIHEPFAKEVAALFQDYWTKCLLKRVTPAEGEAELLAALKACLAKHGKKVDGFESLEDLDEVLQSRLREDGFQAVTGVTPPFRELMLWRKETVRDYKVELPESTQEVKIVFMADFRLFGWAGFATADVYHNGGWTTPEALYCLEESYDLDSEKFKFSYLGHEAQHFADGKRFPKLEPPELEYRAKLVELSKADGILLNLLDNFARQVAEDRNVPHGFANLRLVRRLSRALFGDESASRDAKMWATRKPDEIRQAALVLLKESTKELLVLGADTVERLP